MTTSGESPPGFNRHIQPQQDRVSQIGAAGLYIAERLPSPETTPQIELARELATELHGNQRDKSGELYIGHPARVAQWVYEHGGSEAARVAAWLHDTIEDTEATAESLAERGISQEAIAIVLLLTHDAGKTLEEYWQYIKDLKDTGNQDAILVKLGDVTDNSLESRLVSLPPEQAERLRIKYARAKEILLAE
jgi:(p)ppGpp synthase/HD superfamily hydrolase